MAWLYVMVFGSLLAGLVGALVWWLISGRKVALLAGPVRWFTFAAGLLALLGEITTRFFGASILLPFEMPDLLSSFYWDSRFVIPLALGVVGVVLLWFPIHARAGHGAAELARRSLVSFARARWFVAPGLILALILLLTAVSGAASQPEETTGRYTMYFVDLGAERGMGTSIYGWFYSVPSVIVTGLLVVVVLIGMALVARPPLAANREHDIEVRFMRTRNVVTAGTGALLLHLGLIFSSLAATASMRASFSTSEGHVSFWTAFSALQPALAVASLLCAALGVALWAAVLLSALRVPRRALVTVRS